MGHASLHVIWFADDMPIWRPEIHDQIWGVLVVKIPLGALRHRRRVGQRGLVDATCRDDVTSSIHTVIIL